MVTGALFVELGSCGSYLLLQGAGVEGDREMEGQRGKRKGRCTYRQLQWSNQVGSPPKGPTAFVTGLQREINYSNM